MKYIGVFVEDREHDVDTALALLTDNYIDDGQTCSQTIIDLRDALQYVLGRCKAVELLHHLTVNPPEKGQDLVTLFDLKTWYQEHVEKEER